MTNSNPFTIEIIRSALISITEEMTAIVSRSARSPLLREAGDHSSALTGPQGDLIAQGKDLPVHLGVMGHTVKEFLRAVPLSSIDEGDVWVFNLPSVGGMHLPDVKIVRPIYCSGDIVAFAIQVAHWGDVGGSVPGGYDGSARNIWQEGLQIPPTKIAVRNQLRQDLIEIILANMRGREDRHGDLLAQIAAVRVADERVSALVPRYGVDLFRSTIRDLHDLAERQMRALLTKIPDGVYHGEDWIDSDGGGGKPAHIAVRIEVDGSDIHFDFSATDDAVAGPLNTTPFVTSAAVQYFLKAVGNSEIYNADGALRPIRVTTRAGSLLDPWPASPLAAGNHETSQVVVDALTKALSVAIPDWVSAGGSSTSGLLIFNGQANGAWWSLYEVHSGGEGARIDRDGACVARTNLGNMPNTPVEKIETQFPLRVLSQSVRPASGGGGARRGGDGLVREYLILADGIEVATVVGRRVIPPCGICGGEDGVPARITLRRKGGADEDLDGLSNYVLNSGDRLRIETAGGGGYGNPTR